MVAFMVAAGFHRDPGVLGSRCSVFEGEMRRRLWATVLELELQASVDKGTPSMLSHLQYDCAAPCNIHDDDIHPDMASLPRSQHSATFTDTSYLHLSAPSRALRAALCASHNALHTPPSTTDISTSEAALHAAPAALPTWADPRAQLSSNLLQLQLTQFTLLLLHTPSILHTPAPTRPSPAQTHAVTTVLCTAEAMISLHTELVNKGIFALALLRLDYLRAALLITHIAYHALFPFTARLARSVVDASAAPALRLLEERCMRPGRGSHHYWYLSAAISLVAIRHTGAEGEDRRKLEIEATERVAVLLYRVLALREEGEVCPGQVLLSGGDAAAEVVGPVPTPASMETRLEGAAGDGGFQGMHAVQGWNVDTWGLDDFWFLGDMADVV